MAQFERLWTRVIKTPRQGEIWYVKLPGEVSLAAREVVKITTKICVLYRYAVLGSELEGIYKLSDVEFVEKIN